MLELQQKEIGKINRLTNKTFKLDKRYGKGFFAATYFLKTRTLINKYFKGHIVTMQFFTRKDSIVCGIDEVLALLKKFAKNPSKLKIMALNDGDKVSPMEPVLKITGQYEDFGYLEGSIDGILARRTSVATNCHEIVEAANGKAIMFFGDRDDDPRNHPGDGYAAYVGGIKLICTDAMGEWTGLKGIGTMPHALIVMNNMDVVKAAHQYHDTFPEDKLTVLVDSNNDVITDTLKVAKEFNKDLFAVRIDTSIAIVDKYFERENITDPSIEKHGVNVTLVKALRNALDKEGYNHVKIVVSSGFDVEKVKLFASQDTPVDTYGVGGSLIKCTRSFTGDVVNVDGKAMAKVGRHEIESTRLEEVKL